MNAQAIPLRILFVCTANICRSPTAEVLARHHFGEDVAMFRSAGFLQPGMAPPKMLVDVLADRGYDARDHLSYQLDPASLEAADLVLTMEGEHVQKATLLHADSFSKIIPLKEAAQVAHQMMARSIAIPDLVQAVGVQRDASTYLGSTWDVDDPYNRKRRDYERAVDEIEGLVRTVITPLVS